MHLPQLVLLWSSCGLLCAVVTTVYGRRFESRAARAIAVEVNPQLSVHPNNAEEVLPSDAPRSSGTQGFLPIAGEASWQQQDAHQIA